MSLAIFLKEKMYMLGDFKKNAFLWKMSIFTIFGQIFQNFIIPIAWNLLKHVEFDRI